MTIHNEEKEAAWDAKRTEIAGVVDGLGYPIDVGIRESVVACNMMGIPTCASCEGHATKGSFGAPWIECAALGEPKDRWVGEEEVYAQVAAKYTDNGVPMAADDVRLCKNWEIWAESQRMLVEHEETEEYKNWKQRTELLQSHAVALLDEFYTQRKPSEMGRLIAEDGVGAFRIHTNSPDYRKHEEELPETEREALEARLVTYRTEMEEFATFLHQKFLQN